MTLSERIEIFKYNSPFTEMTTENLADNLVELGYFEAPASTAYHGNYPGGLFDHCNNVYETLLDLTVDQDLNWSRTASPFVIGYLHDLCKADIYQIDAAGVIKYKNETIFRGHGEKSVMMLNDLCLNYTEEEIACIRYHMGAFTDKEEWEFYTRAIHRYPNVLWTHTADMIAAHIKEV